MELVRPVLAGAALNARGAERLPPPPLCAGAVLHSGEGAVEVLGVLRGDLKAEWTLDDGVLNLRKGGLKEGVLFSADTEPLAGVVAGADSVWGGSLPAVPAGGA